MSAKQDTQRERSAYIVAREYLLLCAAKWAKGELSDSRLIEAVAKYQHANLDYERKCAPNNIQ